MVCCAVGVCGGLLLLLLYGGFGLAVGLLIVWCLVLFCSYFWFVLGLGLAAFGSFDVVCVGLVDVVLLRSVVLLVLIAGALCCDLVLLFISFGCWCCFVGAVVAGLLWIYCGC